MISIDALSLLGFLRASPSEQPPLVWRGPWQARLDGSQGMYSAFAAGGGCELVLANLEGPAWLEFMCTAWSGMLEVTDGDQTTCFDSYAPEHTLKDLRLPGTGRRTVTLRVTGARNPAALAGQIWLHRLLLQDRPGWLQRHSRLTDHLTLVDGDVGTFIVLESDKPISHDIKHYGCWGAQQVALFRRIVQPGTVAVDIGANIGHHTVVLSKLVGPGGRILAFEPQPRLARILHANLALNACDNVDVHCVALGAADADAQMFPQDYEGQPWNMGALPIATANGVFQFDATGLPVKIRKLDDLVGSLVPDFIKSDAQGFDFAALKGAEQVLRHSKPMILAEVAPGFISGAGADYQDFYAFLEGLGYLFADPEERVFSSQPRIWNGQASHEWDILAVHQDRHDHFARAALHT